MSVFISEMDVPFGADSRIWTGRDKSEKIGGCQELICVMGFYFICVWREAQKGWLFTRMLPEKGTGQDIPLTQVPCIDVQVARFPSLCRLWRLQSTLGASLVPSLRRQLNWYSCHHIAENYDRWRPSTKGVSREG